MLYHQSAREPNRHKKPLLPKAYSGGVTKGVQKRIGKAVDIFLQTTEQRRVYNTVTGRDMDFRCGFVTLTISDYCNWKADECYTKLLKPYLRILKERYGAGKYVWKYELQQRGNVHYHVLIDQFIEYHKIREAWNRLQHKHRLTDTYATKYGHHNPNSTDIHKIWKVENIGAYVGKYLQKGGQNVRMFHEGFPALYYERDVKGKVWDCSVDLKRTRFSAEFCYENKDRLEDMIELQGCEPVYLENCTILKTKNPQFILTEDQKIDYCVWRYQ